MQAVVLFSTNNPGDAITALSEALEIAESISDDSRQGGRLDQSWARPFMKQRCMRTREIAPSGQRGSLRGHLHFVTQSRGAWPTSRSAACTCKSTKRDLTAFEMRLGLDIRRETPAEILNRVFAEGTYTRLLLALGPSCRSF